MAYNFLISGQTLFSGRMKALLRTSLAHKVPQYLTAITALSLKANGQGRLFSVFQDNQSELRNKQIRMSLVEILCVFLFHHLTTAMNACIYLYSRRRLDSYFGQNLLACIHFR